METGPGEEKMVTSNSSDTDQLHSHHSLLGTIWYFLATG